MSQQQPEPREKLEVDVKTAIIRETTFGDVKTAILFSISDGEWRAVYSFQESISPQAQRNFGMVGAPLIRETWHELGAGVMPSTVTPASPRRVDEFALRPGPARANLRRLDRGPVIRLNLGVEVATRQFEQLQLFLKPPPGSELPSRVELGFVHFLRLELL